MKKYPKPAVTLFVIISTALVLAACSTLTGPLATTETGGEARPYHHTAGGRFRNPPGSTQRDKYVWDLVKLVVTDIPFRKKPDIPADHVLEPDAVSKGVAAIGNPSVTWLGHAAFIVRVGGKTILTDPFLSEVAGPRGIGPSRYVEAAIPADELPAVDAMVISHNHYDHLDTKALDEYRYKDSVEVIVPLGVGSIFTRLGYKNVTEQDWWDEWSAGGLKITALPSVHFSGRGLFDRNKTLWASFAIEAGSEKVWFGGDTGMGEVFREIGQRAGPFDLALVPIGAYAPRSVMKAVHVNPEEAIEIVKLIGAKKAVGMHWGTIILTSEEPFEPPVRFRQAAIDQGLGEDAAWVLKIGETRSFAKNTPDSATAH